MIELFKYNKDGWEIMDAEKLAERYPKSFFLPTKSERSSLVQGDFAKVIFRFDVSGERDGSEERMWLKVDKIEMDRYIGVLDNIPTLISENEFIWRGSKVAFLSKHIIQIIKS